MPVHDWTRVDAGLFHAFHQSWIVRLCDHLNFGTLPAGYFAISAQRTPRAIVQYTDEEAYANKADFVSVRNRKNESVAIVEIISPGNKSNKSTLTAYVKMCVEWIRNGLNVLMVDLFPLNHHNPRGIHHLIWCELADGEFSPPPHRPLMLVSYGSGTHIEAYCEPFAIGEELADMPLFLQPEFYVLTPLEKSYMATWEMFPNPMKKLVQA